MQNQTTEPRMVTEEELTKDYPEWANLGEVTVDMSIKPELVEIYGTKEAPNLPESER